MSNDAVTQYLNRLARALRSLPAEERATIVAEIKSHIEDRSAATGGSPSEALESLGDPLELARDYLDQFRLEDALERSAHSTLLIAILERAGRSLAAAALGFVALCFFLFTASFAAVAVLKPVIPQQVGLWTGPDIFTFAILDKAPASGTELLGYGIIPVAIILGILCFLAGRALTRLGGRILLRQTSVRPRA